MTPLALLAALALLPALAGRTSGPGFAARQRTALLASAGSTAELDCRVLRLADRTVSWVRSSDLQIMTHAGDVFTADTRVSCAETPGLAEDPAEPETRHVLRIARLRPADSGRYECQVNTEPKMSLFFNLTVVESPLPHVVVWPLEGGAVRAVRGGAARLACGARYEPASGGAALPPLRISWTHAGRDVDPQGGRGGVSLEAERWAGGARSQLTLGALRPEDGGRYECRAGGGSAELMLQVDEEDLPGAAQRATGEMQRDQEAAGAAGTGGARPAAPRALLLALLASALLAT